MNTKFAARCIIWSLISCPITASGISITLVSAVNEKVCGDESKVTFTFKIDGTLKDQAINVSITIYAEDNLKQLKESSDLILANTPPVVVVYYPNMAGKIHIWADLHVFHILDKDVSYTTNATVTLDSNDLGIRVQHSGNTVSFKIVDDIKVPGTDMGSRLELSCFDIKAWTRDLKHEWETVKDVFKPFTFTIPNDCYRKLIIKFSICSNSYSEEIKLNRLVQIKNITSHIGRNRVKIEWECDGEEYLPEKTYIIKFNAITGMQLKDRIATGRSNEFGIVRPIKYELEIRPKIDFELEEDILDIIPGKITINAKDEKPKQAPTNIGILASEGKKFYVQFDPVPEEALWGEDRGCEARMCDSPMPEAKCFGQGKSDLQKDTIELQVPLYNTRYYISVACSTSAGRGPWSKFEPPLRKKDIAVQLTVKRGLNIILTWRITVKGKSKFSKHQITGLLVYQQKRENPTSTAEEMVITKEKNLREINIGLSPGFKFDTNCYLYGINVTFRGGFSVTDNADEVCYSVLSPGFLITYGFGLVVLICIILFLAYRRRKGPGGQSVVVMARSTTRTPKVKRGGRRAKRRRRY
ncbi:hypothetical protein Q1695_008148 [Nippostrongylus brasiliensis]|nr:hypothetical protein Q1695_008148 [Nippostrongylus brasiliensis]